jgi:hypothetical protein
MRGRYQNNTSNPTEGQGVDELMIDKSADPTIHEGESLNNANFSIFTGDRLLSTS